MPDKVRPGTVVAVTVPIARLHPKVAPQICLKTGEVGQVLVPTTAVAVPSWAWVLILAGGVPYLAARRWLFPRQRLELIARHVVFEKQQLFRRVTAGVFAVIGVVLAWSLATVDLGGIVLAFTLADAATAAWVYLVPTFWVNAELQGNEVRLVGVHPHVARVFS